MMANFLHVQLTEIALASTMIYVLADEVTRENCVWYTTEVSDDEPFVMEAVTAHVVIEQRGHLSYPDLPGFRLVFTFHQVDTTVVVVVVEVVVVVVRLVVRYWR